MPASTTGALEIPYEISDLKRDKADVKRYLVSLIARQEDKWPGPDVYTDRSTTVKRLRSVLLDPLLGFTKPAPASLPEPDQDRSSGSESLSPPPTEKDDTHAEQVQVTFETTLYDKGNPYRWIKLLVEDTRNIRSTKISQELPLFVIDQQDCGPGQWRAACRDLLQELQASNSAITGPVRISFRDQDDLEYWVPFVRVTGQDLLKDAPTWPSHVVIPSNSHLEILVEHAEDIERAAAPGTSTTGQQNIANNLATRRQNDDADVQWLREQLKDTPGYQTFKDNQRKVQTNPGVAASWTFIGNFSETHFGTPSQTSNRKTIKKQSIYKALGLKSTAFAEAEKAARILKRYGAGGSHPAGTVIKQVKLEEDPPKGARVLYPFLVNYDKKHTKK